MLGAVHKIRPQSGVRRFVQCGHFSDKGEGVLQMRTSTFFDAKISFFEKYIVTGTRGVRVEEIKPVRTFCRLKGGEGQFFCDFLRTSCMDGPLMYLKRLTAVF